MILCVHQSCLGSVIIDSLILTRVMVYVRLYVYVEVKLDRLLFLLFFNLGFYVPIDSLAMICSSFTPRFTVAFDHVVLCKRVANFLSFVCVVMIWYQFQKFLICNFVLKFNCWYKWYCKSKKNLWSRNRCAEISS